MDMTQDQNSSVAKAEEPNAPPETGLKVIGLEDLEAVDCEAPLADSKKLCCASFGPLYRTAGEAAKQQGDEQ